MRDPLKDWHKRILWLKPMDGEQVEIAVWYPSATSHEEFQKLLQNHASQMVKIIRQLTGTTSMIAQGQYKVEPNGN